MRFGNDAQLLVIEPRLFADVLGCGVVRVLVEGVGEVSGSVLSATAVPTFDAARVEPGMVVVVERVACEVVSVLSGGDLELSRPRAWPEDRAVPLSDFAGARFAVVTAQPQAQVVNRAILRAIGVQSEEDRDSGEDLREGWCAESALMNRRDFVRLEGLMVVRDVLRGAEGAGLGAGFGSGGSGALRERIAMYDTRVRKEWARAVARLDTDGDGVVDCLVRLGPSAEVGGVESVWPERV
jgi:hypothetical protein